MTAWLASTYHPTRLAGRDLRARARVLAGDRKVFRMLDELSIPPFVAALEAWDEAGTVASPARTAIFTVSAWEPDVPVLDGAPDEPWEARIRYYQQQALPSQMLRSMPNGTLCHVAIAAGFRGPNAHYVGDGASVGQVLHLARIELDAGTADAVVVATFDELPPAAQAVSAAATRIATGAAEQMVSAERTAGTKDRTAGTVARSAGDAGRAVTPQRGEPAPGHIAGGEAIGGIPGGGAEGAEEQERTDRPVGIGETGPAAPDGVGHHPHGGRRVVAAACVLSAAAVAGAASVRIPAREAWGGASPTAALVSWFERIDRVEGAA